MSDEREKPLDLEPLLNQDALHRRKLIPIVIKIFIWIFIVCGAFVPIALLISVLGYRCELALYGLETHDPLSSIGLSLSGIFLLKGVVGFALWTERDWAVKLAIVDAIIGIVVCLAVMTVPFWNKESGFVFRLELVALIPYLMWLSKTKPRWEGSSQLAAGSST
jgi:hypothetical protein